MGSQVMEIAVWVFSIVIVSTFLGMIFQVLRGVFDGYMDRWEEKYLDNKKFEYEGKNKIGVQGGDYYQPVKEKPNSEQFRPPHPSDAVDDKDVQDFLEWADEPGPWSEEDDKIYTVGGLTADKDQSFKAFQEKQNQNTQSWVDEEESDYDSFSDGRDSDGGEDYDDSNEY